MTEAFIPFDPSFEAAIKDGRKIMTCRNRRYGEPGDILVTPFGFNIQLTDVRQVELEYVRDRCWSAEGCDSPKEFQAIWVALHPVSGWTPKKKVWLHTFLAVRP